MSKPRIAFQGEPGANSHEACARHFPDHEPLPCPTFEDAFEALRSGAAALALIPIENSVAGRVADVHHLLPDSGLKIVGERFMPIRHQLLGAPGATLEGLSVVRSHVMALAQCRRIVREHGWRAEAVSDTAGAARALSQAPEAGVGVIASALAARLYGLPVLAKDVEDARHNTTRFLVMTAEAEPAPPPFTSPCVTSFVFRVRNLPAALYKGLGGFATNGVNMTKLESYMEDGAFTATMFYAEVDGRPEDRGLANAFEELRFFTERFEVLGVYPADGFRKR